MIMEPVSMEEQALKRREKLLALKRKRDETKESNSTNKEEKSESLPQPIFRSYKPIDEALDENNKLPDAEPGNVISQVQDQLEAAKSSVVIDELDITTLAPRKPDWDLKRDVAKKLEKLERKTQRAIAELIRERLKEQKDLAGAADVDKNM